MLKLRAHGVVVALLVLACGASLAAAPGFVVRNCEMRNAPSFSGQVMQRLAPGSGVTLLERRGGWQQVELTGTRFQGWVRSYQVRAGQLPPTVVKETRDEQRGVLSDLASLSRSASGLLGAGNRAGTNQTTATIGIRGLSAEELEAAKPDQAQLEQLKKYAVSPKTGKKFAKSAKLKKRKVKTLDGKS
jgi:hypothetical protein